MCTHLAIEDSQVENFHELAAFLLKLHGMGGSALQGQRVCHLPGRHMAVLVWACHLVSTVPLQDSGGQVSDPMSPPTPC